MDCINYIKEKDWHYKVERDQFCVQICPLCGDDKWHFYIGSQNGAWFCHKCQEKGNLYQLQKGLGDMKHVQSVAQVVKKDEELKPLDTNAYLQLQKALSTNENAMDYLKAERGFKKETINHFRLGLKRYENTDWLTIPHFSNGNLINVKYRSLPPAEKQFKRVPGRPSILFNEDCLKEEFTELFIAEGETDAMSLWQIGFKNVVGTTAGAGSFLPEWHEKLEDIEQIYLCFDSDETGKKGAYAVADKLGFERCKNIILPEGQDLNDYLKKHTREDFVKLAAMARKFKIPSISSISEVIHTIDREQSQQQKQGILTPWDNVNKKIGSFAPGDLIILSAVPKTGKTTFSLNIAHQNAKEGIPCLFYCLEMRPERLLIKVLSNELNREVIFNDREIIAATRERIENLPLYFGYSYKRVEREYVLNIIRNAVKRYDIEFVVFDNLHFLVRNIKYVTHEVGLVTQSFKLLAEELEIPIMLIAQPRKTNPNEMMNMLDLKDSASIGADADQIIILHRKPLKSDKGDGISRAELETTLEPETLVRVEASRYHPGGDTMLYFDGAKSKFRRLEEQ
jgi:replicative DNA helicase